MKTQIAWCCCLAALCGCAPAPESHSKAILGAVLIDGAGGPPLSNSVVVTAEGLVRAAGARSAVPIPAEADKIDGSGKWIAPAPIDACDRMEPAALMRASTPEEARRRVAEMAGKQPVVYLGNLAPEVAEAAIEAARAANLPVLASVAKAADAKFLVDRGASGFIGMIVDTEDLDPSFVRRARDLRIAFAPALISAGSAVEIAKRNTRRLFEAGVPIAAATRGGDLQREIELLVDAGLPPLDAIVAATRNSATLLRRSDAGTLEPGKRADLLLLSANPGEDVRNLRNIALRMKGGQWVK